MRVGVLLLSLISAAFALHPLTVRAPLATGDEVRVEAQLSSVPETMLIEKTAVADEDKAETDVDKDNEADVSNGDEEEHDDAAAHEDSEEHDSENDDEDKDEAMLNTASTTETAAKAAAPAAKAVPAKAAPAEAAAEDDSAAMENVKRSSGGPTFPLWYTTTMLGQAALSGGYSPMGGLGTRATTTGPAHGGQVRSKLVPLAPQAYETAMLATHLAVRTRANHAGTIPLGADDYERRAAMAAKQYHDMTNQAQMMYGGFHPMNGMPAGYPMMGPQGFQMPQMQQMQQMPMQPGMMPQMPMQGMQGYPMMGPQGYQMPQMNPQMNPYGNPMMGGAPYGWDQGMAGGMNSMYGAAPTQMKANKAVSKSGIQLKGDKIEGLTSSLLGEIAAANKKGNKSKSQ